MNESMRAPDAKLMRCFEAVFPELSVEQIRNASPRTVADWNSLSAVTLISVIEDEFKVTISLTELAELDSYEAFHEYLSAKSSTGARDDE